MNITLPKRVFMRMTDRELMLVDRTHGNLRGVSSHTVSLVKLDTEDIAGLRAALARLKSEGTRKLAPLIADIDLWTAITRGELDLGNERPQTLHIFADLLTQCLLNTPGHRVYLQEKDTQGWLAHYTNYIEFHNERRDRDGYIIPACVDVVLMYWLLGARHLDTVTFHNSDVNGYTVAEALAAKGIVAETPGLRGEYLKVQEEFLRVFDDVGRQYTTGGQGIGMGKSWSSYRDRIAMMDGGSPAKVVVDVPHTSEDKSRGNGGHPRTHFWNEHRPTAVANENTEDLSLNKLKRPQRDDGLVDDPEIPVHPYVPVYHLERHTRYRVHVSEMRIYEFNKDLDKQLILPDQTKILIEALVSQGRISFKDIVEGKGEGACILLGGPPGVGKTLTAQVFAEATERPLLSVQAAQLGVNPDTIEREFRAILNLGSRWNAVVLLDEADVYIAKRGNNLAQNSIVASFLRILEQHTATIFMTTNRAEDVDDAVLSRCLARITYAAPDTDSQKLIWRVMADLNGVNMAEHEIETIVRRHHSLTGRDIKQTLKLATLWAAGHDGNVTPEIVDFVTGFLPTLNGHSNETQCAADPGSLCGEGAACPSGATVSCT